MEMKTSATKSLQNACSLFSQDLDALPEEAFTESFGPATRTVADIVYEVNMVNDHIGMAMRGEEQPKWPDGWVKAPADFQTKDEVVNGFKQSSEQILNLVAPFTDEDIDVVLKENDGERTRADRCRFMALHIWYHSGQLNFIQTLLGDDAWHWK